MFVTVRRSAACFSRDQAGSNAIEYGLIVAFLSLAIVAGGAAAGNAMRGMFAQIGDVVTIVVAGIPAL